MELGYWIVYKMWNDDTIGEREDPGDDPRSEPQQVFGGDGWISMLDARLWKRLPPCTSTAWTEKNNNILESRNVYRLSGQCI